MTQLKPTIIIRRLLATRFGKAVYDEEFHEGINVICGGNGGGKTSVIQLLVYGLGYDVKNWKDEASQSEFVYLGLTINNNPITLRRKNERAEKQSMDICFSPLEEALQSSIEDWNNFPYAINASKESFSQKLFSLMDIPEAKDDVSNNNITIHQLLRIIYNDQSNPASFVFNIEPFDSAFKRETVGNYLLGLHDDELYNAKIQLAAEEKKLDKAITKLHAIYSILGKTDYTSDLDDIDKAREAYLQTITKLNEEIQEARLSTEISAKTEKSITEKQAGEVIGSKAKLLECESKIGFLEYEIDDSKDFLRELQDKSNALSDSIKVGDIFPKIVFDICPSCYKKIEPKSDNCCHLCGADQEDNEHSRSTNLLRMKNEVDIQIRESTKLLAKKIEKLSLLNKEKTVYSAELRKSISKVSATITTTNSYFEAKVYDIYQKIGETEQKLDQLNRTEELSKTVKNLIEDKQNSQVEVNKLKSVIELKKAQFLRRTPEIHQAISEHLINILKQDNGAEKEFKNAMAIEFDFASNKVAVNEKTTFSESGDVLLNNAFHVALLAASLEKGYVRLPRLMILDGIENGGMEDKRSQNFQRVVKEHLESYGHPYQLIFATKSIYEGLDSEEYIVGQKYSEDNQSLKM